MKLPHMFSQFGVRRLDAAFLQTGSDESKAVSSHRTPKPEWLHPSRSALSFWTPPAALVLATALLVLCWPHARPASVSPSLPEPSAAYVLFEGGAQWVSPDSMLDPAKHVFDRATTVMEDAAPVAPRNLPAPEYTPFSRVEPWQPDLSMTVPAFTPNLAARPVADVLSGLQSFCTGGVSVALSPGLQNCGFSFELPDSVATNAPASATFHVETDDAGRVIYLLAEPSDNPDAARLLENAINIGRASRAGRGDIQVSWGR